MIQKVAVSINFGEDSIVKLQCTVFAHVWKYEWTMVKQMFNLK
jgi:hypothetical protein